MHAKRCTSFQLGLVTSEPPLFSLSSLLVIKNPYTCPSPWGRGKATSALWQQTSTRQVLPTPARTLCVSRGLTISCGGRGWGTPGHTGKRKGPEKWGELGWGSGHCQHGWPPTSGPRLTAPLLPGSPLGASVLLSAVFPTPLLPQGSVGQATRRV